MQSTPIKRKLDGNIDDFNDGLDADLSDIDYSDELPILNVLNSGCVTSTLQRRNVEKLPGIIQGKHYFVNSFCL